MDPVKTSFGKYVCVYVYLNFYFHFSFWVAMIILKSAVLVFRLTKAYSVSKNNKLCYC